MRKKDLKAGMLLLCEECGKRELCLVSYNSDGRLNWSGEHIWSDEDVLNDDLTYGLFPPYNKILKVYDRIDGNRAAHELKTDRRQLLWERKEPTELTVEEIEKLLGYPIKVVK